MLDHRTRDDILDPRRSNLGNLGVALKLAAEAKRDRERDLAGLNRARQVRLSAERNA